MSSKSLGTLTLDLVAKTGGFVEGLSKAQRGAKNWRRQVERDLKRVGKAFAAVGAAAAGTIAALTKQGADFVDSQAKTADRLDATIDGLRAAQIVAADFQVGNEQLAKAVTRLNRELAGAVDGSGNAAEALDKLGLNARTLMNMDVDARMAAIADSVQGLGLNAAQTGDLLRDLGVRNEEIINILLGGGDAFAAAREEVNEYGLSLSRIDAAKVEATNDALSRTPRLLEPIKTQLAVSFAEPLEGINSLILEAGRETQGFKSEIDALVDSAVTGFAFVANAVDGFKTTVQVAGRFAALMVIDFQRDLAKLAEFIYSGPIDAVNALITQINRIPGIDIGGVEQFGFVKDLQNQVDQFERASQIARDDIKGILSEQLLGDRIREAVAEAREPDLKIGGAIGEDALKASRDVAEALNRTAAASTAAGDAADENTRETSRASRAVNDFSQSAVNGANAIARATSFNWEGDPGAYGAKQPSSVQERINSRRDPGVINYQANPSAHSTWGGDLGSSRMNSAASSVNRSDSGNRRNLGTLTLKSENGEIDVEANSDELNKWLASTLSGTAAAT